MAQVLRFYEGQGLKLPQQPPLLMVKSAELGNAASREQHPSSDRETPRGLGGAPVMHTRWRPSPASELFAQHTWLDSNFSSSHRASGAQELIMCCSSRSTLKSHACMRASGAEAKAGLFFNG